MPFVFRIIKAEKATYDSTSNCYLYPARVPGSQTNFMLSLPVPTYSRALKAIPMRCRYYKVMDVLFVKESRKSMRIISITEVTDSTENNINPQKIRSRTTYKHSQNEK